MKKLLGILLTVLLCLTCVCALASEYSIPSAAFTADLQTDGSAIITEEWTVKFISGSFTRFYKDISYSSLPTDEKFTAISDVSVWIDGVECTPTNDTSGRPDLHYNLSGTKPGATLSAYMKSSGVTRTYRFRYRVKDVIKRVDDAYDLFVFRFVGANFSKTIRSISVQVNAPDGQITCLYNTSGKAEVSGSTLTVTGSSVSGMFKVGARIDGASIPGAVKISASDLSNAKDGNSGSDASEVLLAFAMTFATFLGFPLLLKRRRIQFERGMADGTLEERVRTLCRQENWSAPVCAAALCRVPTQMFFLCTLWMQRKGCWQTRDGRLILPERVDITDVSGWPEAMNRLFLNAAQRYHAAQPEEAADGVPMESLSQNTLLTNQEVYSFTQDFMKQVKARQNWLRAEDRREFRKLRAILTQAAQKKYLPDWSEWTELSGDADDPWRMIRFLCSKVSHLDS